MSDPGSVRKQLPPEDEARIVAAIGAAEARTSGEIRVHVEGKGGGDALAAARARFVRLGMDRTAERNGVLVYVALLDRKFAIVGDEGIHSHVGSEFWDALRDGMSARFAAGDLVGGIEEALRSIGERLAEAFPRSAQDSNELPDEVSTDDEPL